MVRPDLHVDADDWLADLAGGVKAGVAQSHAQLVFALCVEAAAAFVAGGVFRTTVLFAGVNFGVDFKREHFNS